MGSSRYSRVSAESKGASFADYSVSLPPKDTSHYSYHALSHKSSSFLQRGSQSEDMVPEEIEIEEIDEAEFRKRETHYDSKIECSNGRELFVDLSAACRCKNVDDASTSISSADHSVSLVDKSDPFAKKGNNNKSMSCREIEINQFDEAEFKNGKSSIASKIGSSSRHYAANSRKNVDIVEEVSYDNCCGSFSSESAGSDSDHRQTDKSSSFAEKGNNGEDTDSEELGIEIDESEFRNTRKNFVLEKGPSAWQEPDEGHFAATSGKDVRSMSRKMAFIAKIDRNKRKREASCYLRRKSKNEPWIINLLASVNNSSLGCINISTSSYSDMQGDEISSYDATHEMDLGVASRTRSKMRITKKNAEVGNASLDSDSLSTDSGYHSFRDKDIEVECSNNSDGIEFLGSYVETCEVQDKISMEVLAEKSESGRKQEGSAVEHASKRRHLDLQKESNGEQPNFQKQKFSSMKRQLSDDANAKESSEERSRSPKMMDLKQLYAEIDRDEAKRVNGLHSKDHSQAGIKRQKEAASSSLKCDYDHSDNGDDILEETEAISADLCGHGKTETVHVADYFYNMLADAALGIEPMLETKGSDETANQAPPSQTQYILPSKFRFEDEVPKEVEKTEYEKEMDGLFAELDFNYAINGMGRFKYPKVRQDNGNGQDNGNHPAEETQHARCAKGKHELVLKDDEGLICKFCHHVELEARDILPPWVEKTYKYSKRKKYPKAEDLLEFDGLQLQSSINNVADFSNTANGTVWSIKPGVRESMYEHQQEGFEFLWENLAGSINLDELQSTDRGGVGGCIISHAPGTGKTRLTVVFLETYMKMFPSCCPVIISPASMLLTWEEEFRKWNVEFPFLNLNNPEFSGKENETALRLLVEVKRQNKEVIRMAKICSWRMGGSILGISYSLFEKLTGEKYLKKKTNKAVDDKMTKMRKILLEKPGLVVLDEGHTPRNQRSNIWNVLLKLQTEKRVILSGTPFQNNFAELFNTLRLVRPAIADMFEQQKTFAEMIASRRKFSSRRREGEHSQSPLISEVVDRAVERLKFSMSPFVHVHQGTILQQSLPGLRDCVVLLRPSSLQKSLIERLQGLPSNLQFEHKVALLSVHPYLLQHSADSTEEQRTRIDMAAVEASKLDPNEGVKTKFILELVRLSMLLKEKVLIFSQYLQPLELIKEQLKEIFKWIVGKQILQMQGKLEQKQRQRLINAFNDPRSESKVMLASMRCCSEGISLIGASRVVLLDVVWNPSVERQAISRAYRIGQKKFVYTYHLLTSGTTEAEKYCRQVEKERLSELVFASTNENNKQKQPSMSIEDRILEEMVGHEKLNDMFEKIINQPKDTDLIQTFGLTS